MIGWIGSICFAACGMPQAWKCYRQGHAQGLSLCMLLLWLVGELCYIYAVLSEFGWVGWMMFNYSINIACLMVMLWFWLRPRK